MAELQTAPPAPEGLAYNEFGQLIPAHLLVQQTSADAYEMGAYDGGGAPVAPSEYDPSALPSEQSWTVDHTVLVPTNAGSKGAGAGAPSKGKPMTAMAADIAAGAAMVLAGKKGHMFPFGKAALHHPSLGAAHHPVFGKGGVPKGGVPKGGVPKGVAPVGKGVAPAGIKGAPVGKGAPAVPAGKGSPENFGSPLCTMAADPRVLAMAAEPAGSTEQQRKWPRITASYKTKMCRFGKNCPWGEEMCEFAHTAVELRVNPNAKRLLCKNLPNCRYGENCIYAHSPEEVASAGGPPTRLVAQKTRFCVVLQTRGFCKFGDQCSFAHSTDELKRGLQDADARAVVVKASIEDGGGGLSAAPAYDPSGTPHPSGTSEVEQASEDGVVVSGRTTAPTETSTGPAPPVANYEGTTSSAPMEEEEPFPALPPAETSPTTARAMAAAALADRFGERERSPRRRDVPAAHDDWPANKQLPNNPFLPLPVRRSRSAVSDKSVGTTAGQQQDLHQGVGGQRHYQQRGLGTTEEDPHAIVRAWLAADVISNEQAVAMSRMLDEHAVVVEARRLGRLPLRGQEFCSSSATSRNSPPMRASSNQHVDGGHPSSEEGTSMGGGTIVAPM